MTWTGGWGLEVLSGFRLVWVRSGSLPAGEGWLTPAEREVLASLRLEKRRHDWLLGRWAAKQAVRALLGAPLPTLEILADADGRPVAGLAPGPVAGLVPGPATTGVTPSSTVLSISHSGGMGLAVASLGSAGLGCDVETIEARSDAFVADYFTASEAAVVQGAAPGDRAWMANLIWSAKESALKALGEGLRLDTRTVVVDTRTVEADTRAVEADTRAERVEDRTGKVGPETLGGADSSWSPLRVAGPGGRAFEGWWRVRDGRVWTVLGEVRPGTEPFSGLG